MNNAFIRAVMLSGLILVLFRCWNLLDYTFVGA